MTNHHESNLMLVGGRGASRRRGTTRDDEIPVDDCIVTVGTLSHIGRKRSSNQDSFCALVGSDAPSGSDALLAVADGMGGHKAGDVASEMAVQGLSVRLSRDDLLIRATDDLVPTLKQTFSELNTEIHMAAALPETRGMGTTLTAAVIVGGSLTIGHVGDSRAYLLRENTMRQLTEDHSWVADQVAKGLITSQEAEFHPGRSILTRAVGVAPSVHVDSITVELKEGDLLVLCSDGVHSLVKDDELVKLLGSGDPQSSSRNIVDLANAKGGSDNITVIVGAINGLGAQSATCES